MVLTAWVLDGSDLSWENPSLSGELIRYQSDHNDYMCSHGVVSMLGDDGMGPSTRVLVARHAWVFVVTSCHARF
jgi:hypothetical protein